MNKKIKLFTGIILSLVVVVVLVAVFYPTPDKEGLEGTVGKVDKYRTDQSGNEKIVLRTEFIKDTVVVGKTIRDLAQFTLFTYQLNQVITETWIPQLRKSNIPATNPKIIRELEEFTLFLRNSNETLNKTIVTLAEIYYSKKDYKTEDIENRLINFVNYVRLMIVKDSILMQTIYEIDKYIASDKATQKNKQQINNLKTIRDRIVMDNFVVACALGDEKSLKTILDLEVFSTATIKTLLDTPPVSGGGGSNSALLIPEAANAFPIVASFGIPYELYIGENAALVAPILECYPACTPYFGYDVEACTFPNVSAVASIPNSFDLFIKAGVASYGCKLSDIISVRLISTPENKLNPKVPDSAAPGLTELIPDIIGKIQLGCITTNTESLIDKNSTKMII